MNQKIQDALNKQLNAELYSSYLYLSMSACLELKNLMGMASWMRTQAREELEHAMKYFNFIHERNGQVTLTQVDAPETQWDSPLDVFENAYQHERSISKMIHEIVDLSISENDHAANNFLQWFVTEQVEEEATVLLIVEKLKMIGDSGVAVFMLDAELAHREITSSSE